MRRHPLCHHGRTRPRQRVRMPHVPESLRQYRRALGGRAVWRCCVDARCAFRIPLLAPVARGFCSHCGTPLYLAEDGDEVVEIAICTLDTPDAVTPQYLTGVEGEVAWFKILHELPRETTEESRPREELDRLGSLQHPDYDTESWVVRG